MSKNEKINIDYFYKYNGFWKLLIITEKYDELYKSWVGIGSMFLAILSASIFSQIFNSLPISDFQSFVRNILMNLALGLVNALGFIIGGLALFSGTIVNKLITNVDKDNKVKHLIGILYSFFFEGAIIGGTIIALLFVYNLTYISIPVHTVQIEVPLLADKVEIPLLLFGTTALLAYGFCFSILYAVNLLGTCLKLFLLSYKFSQEEAINSKEGNS